MPEPIVLALKRLAFPKASASGNTENKNGCAIEMVDVFSLKFQRDNWKNALVMDPAKGKTGEKVCIFTALRK